MSFLRANGNLLRAGLQFLRAIPRSSDVVTVTDDFEAYTTGALAGQGNWVVLNGVDSYNVTDVSGDNVLQLPGGSYAGNRRSESVSNSQYAQVRIDLSGPSHVGVGVRLSTATTFYNGFQYHGGSADSYVSYVVHDEETIINGGSASFSTNDVIRLEVEGTTLRAYKNGVLDTSNGGTGEYDISSIVSTNPVLASGSIGICGGSSGMRIDDFVGGDL